MTVTERKPDPRHARAGTIVWGAILVAVSIFSVTALLGARLGAATILWGVVGFGGVLIVAALVTAVIRAVRTRQVGPTDEVRAETLEEGHQPIG